MKVVFQILRMTALLLLAIPLLAQQHNRSTDPFRESNKRALAQNPAGVTFAVRLKNNQTKFQIGETITLELNFSSTVANKFRVDNATYDRSGRLEIDHFHLDHEDGTADPLADYFNSLQGYIGGGIRSYPDLTEKPVVITSELNEWIRFDQPGRYRLFVSSSRVGQKRDHYVGGEHQSTIVSSNIVEFEIIPADPKWAKRQLDHARQTLEQSAVNAYRGACRQLRFLGTKAAVIEMIRLMGRDEDECDWTYMFGLMGSPHRAFVTQQMERALVAPEYPVTSGFVFTLSRIAFSGRTTRMPAYPLGNDELEKEWQAKADEQHEIQDETTLSVVRQLAAAISRKTPDAQAVSLETLLGYAVEAKSDGLLTAQLNQAASLLPDLFERLPIATQHRILTYEWKTVASDRMLPLLRKAFELPNRPNLQEDYEREQLRTIALKRIYQLVPNEGRRLIIDEARRPEPSVPIAVLGILPDETLPELDDSLITNYERSLGPNPIGDTEAIADLIARYASSAIASRVQAEFEKRGPGRMACRLQASLLAYLLRVNSPSGKELLAQSLAARGSDDSGCFKTVVSDVAELRYTPEVEAIALELLHDDGLEQVVQASNVLKKFGSAEVEEKLWTRFIHWHETTKSKAPELRKVLPGIPAYGAPPLSGEVAMEQALSTALTHGYGWFADSDKLKKIRALCLSEYCEKEIDNALLGAHQMISIQVSPRADEPVIIWVAQYQLNSIAALKKKLVQFPRGTRFEYRPEKISPEPERLEKIFTDLKSYLENNGMKLERIE